VTRSAGVALAALLAGCGSLPTTSEGVAFLQVELPANRTLLVGDTLRLHALALDKSGQPLDIPVSWRTPDATITVDPATGLVTGVAAGTGRVQATVGTDELVSDFIALTVKDAATALRRP
jgi:uncharacterized protein YjdB